METNLNSYVLKKFICFFIPEVSAVLANAEKENSFTNPMVRVQSAHLWIIDVG